MGAYTIRELENLSGVKAHTIRIWEKRYGLITPKRTSTNIRTYCDSELKKLLNISLLNRNGIKISTIARLSYDEIIRRIDELTDDVNVAENQIESLKMAMIELDEHNFEQVLAKSIIHLGFEETVVQIVYPFLKKVGLMWQTGQVSPAQEHFITNLIRQKFLVAIDGLVTKYNNANEKRFVLFLPEGELHEIGLLFLYYLIKKRGHKIVYLGQSMPLNDLLELVRNKNADYLVTAITSTINGQNPDEYLRILSNKIADKILFVGGSLATYFGKGLPPNVKTVNSLSEIKDQLDQLL